MLSRPASALLLLVLLAAASRSTTPAAEADTRHFELRIYNIPAGKMEAVFERFRDQIGRIRAKHGIETLGYWTTTNQAGADVFVYLVTGPGEEKFRASERAFGADPEFKQVWDAASKRYGQTVDKIVRYPLRATDWSPKIAASAASPARAFELRVYDVLPEKMDAYLANYRDARLKLFEKHGFANLGFWTTTGPNQPNKFVMLLAHGSAKLIDDSKAAYHKSPEWKAAVDEWNKQVGKTTMKVVLFTLRPAGFSPWK